MKKVICLLVPVLLLLQLGAFAYNGDTKVYITNTGECYHRGSCGYLHSKHEVTLEEAVERGYRACSRCRPPKLESRRTNLTVSDAASVASSEASSDTEDSLLSFSNIPAIIAIGVLALPYVIFVPVVFIYWPFQRLRKRYRRRVAEEFLESRDGACLRDKFFRAGYKTRIKEEEAPLTKPASDMSMDEYLDTWLKKTALTSDKSGENQA